MTDDLPRALQPRPQLRCHGDADRRHRRAADGAGAEGGAMRYPANRGQLLSKAVINWETGCWEWTACLSSSGYGRIRIGGVTKNAHRVAYELIEGPIPEGLHLDHLCRVRRCINPAHLEPVTNRENVLRSPTGFTAVNARKTHCPAGHEYTPENTSIRRSGARRCRACHLIKSHARYARQKEAA